MRQSSVKGYEIIAGERRFRASKLAGKETIPAIIRNFDEEAMMQVAVLENLQREDLNPLEEAEAYDMLMKNLKLTQAQVAERLGKAARISPIICGCCPCRNSSKKWFKMTVCLWASPDIIRLENKEQILKLANRCVKENLTVRQLEQMVAEMNDTKTKRKSSASDSGKTVLFTRKRRTVDG